MKDTEGGVLLHVKLTPNASRNTIQGWAEGVDGMKVLKVSVTAIPEDGKANAALIKLLAKHCRLPKGAFILKNGATDRQKTILIQNTRAASLPF